MQHFFFFFPPLERDKSNQGFTWHWAIFIIIRQNISKQLAFQCSKIPILPFSNVSSEIEYNTSGICLLDLSHIDSDLSKHRKDHVANHSQEWISFWLRPLPLTLGGMLYAYVAEQLYFFYSLKQKKQPLLNIHIVLLKKYICRRDYWTRLL